MPKNNSTLFTKILSVDPIVIFMVHDQNMVSLQLKETSDSFMIEDPDNSLRYQYLNLINTKDVILKSYAIERPMTYEELRKIRNPFKPKPNLWVNDSTTITEYQHELYILFRDALDESEINLIKLTFPLTKTNTFVFHPDFKVETILKTTN